MKKISLKIIGVVFLLSLLSIRISNAQNDLAGKWVGKCIIEKTDPATLTFCDFCPYTESADSTSIFFEEFEMNFEKDSFNLTYKDVAEKMAYILDADMWTLMFSYRGNEYKFRLMPVAEKGKDSRYVLKDDDGMLLLLERND